MGVPDDDAQAPTLAQAPSSDDRASRSEIADLQPSTTIGRYQLVSRIGAGAMGVVWSALDPQLDRHVAIKLVHPGLARSPEASTRLLREARAMAKLSHRAVVTVHDAGEVDGRLFLAMEMVEGTHLGALLRTRSDEERADWRRWLTMMLEAGRGLEAAHKAGVLHRDFKPDNVLVDTAGRVCVGDFGVATLGESSLAVFSERASRHALELTTTGALLGTPAYMSPQQLRGETVDARADQFSFCVATWQALHGTRPFKMPQIADHALAQLAASIEAGPPAPPATTTVPAALTAALRRGLAAEPDARWPDMGSLLVALERAGRLERGRARSDLGTSVRVRRRVLALVAAIAVAVVAIAFVVGGRSGSKRAVAPPPAVTAKRLFSVPMRTGLALSPDGTRLALNSDRLQVHDLATGKVWSTVLAHTTDEVSHLEFAGDTVRFSVRSQAALMRWRYATDELVTTEIAKLGGYWMGRTVAGDLVYDSIAVALSVIDDGRVISRWDVSPGIDASAISPDRRRVAYIERGRFQGRLIVREIAGGHPIASEPIEAPTAITWVDDRTLLYARGTLTEPTIHRLPVLADRFGTPTEVYKIDAGWFGPMQAHGDRVFVLEMHPSPRPRLVDRTATQSSSRDLDQGSVALGWLSSTEFLSWNKYTQKLEIRMPHTIAITAAVVDGEPANATMADDIVIVSMRRPGGRETLAVTRTTGRELWRHRDARTFAVRCAGDQRPPCFAIRTEASGDQIVTIDPHTGELGTTVLHRGKIEDLAVRPDGARLLVAGVSRQVLELDPGGALIETHAVPITIVRSIAYDPRGGMLLGGTQIRNIYQVGQFHDGVFTLLAQSDGDILMLVRPSPDGHRVLVLARVYSPEVVQLTLGDAR